MSERMRRILELQRYAKDNYNTILREAEIEIKQLGWAPAEEDDPFIKVDTITQPCLQRRGTLYRRPWADFLLTIMDIAQRRYFVTEATAKSYAKAALQPLEAELLTRKWKGANGTPWRKKTPSR